MQNAHAKIKVLVPTWHEALSVSGPKKSVRRLLWITWAALTLGLILEHQSWHEILWSPGILIVALTWRIWWLFPLCYFHAHLKLWQCRRRLRENSAAPERQDTDS